MSRTSAGLAYEDTGAGDRTILLIHGRPFDHTMWRPRPDAFNALLVSWLGTL